MLWHQNQDCFLPSLHLAKDFLIWQIMALQITQMAGKVFKNVTEGLEDPDWLISAAVLQMSSLTLVPSQETNRFSFFLNFSFHYMLQQNANTWSLSCAGLADKDPVQGWMCHTSTFLRGLDSSERESRKVHSPVLGLTGKLYNRHWLCPPQLKAVHDFLPLSPTAKTHWFAGSVLLEHNTRSYYRFPMVTKMSSKSAPEVWRYLLSWNSNVDYKFWVLI